MALRLLLAVALALGMSGRAAAQTAPPADALTVFLDRLRDLTLKGDSQGISALSASGTNTDDFVQTMTPAPTSLVIKERDRTPIAGGGQRLLLEIFSTRDAEARVFTWQMDLGLPAGRNATDPAEWRVLRMDRMSIVSGLYRLELDVARQYDVHNLTLKAPDLTLQMASGVAFLSTTPDGPTGVVLLGRGRLEFAPQDASERTQIAIFSGAEKLTTEFDAVLVRIRPSDFAASFSAGTLTPGSIVPADVRRASSYFTDYIGRTLNVDLNDLSRDRWSLVPQQGDLIAEIRTKRYGNLTYSRAQSDAEDVSFFDRRRKKNIAVYASQERLASRGRFYSEDDGRDYDVTSYDVEADFSPERLWIDGRATLSLKVTAPFVTSMTLRIADSLTVRSVHAQELGRLMYLRVVGQNAVIVNFPVPVARGAPLTLRVVYSGRVEPQELDREALALDQPQEQEAVVLLPEPRYIYSNRSYWYPQGTVPDYTTARLTITVPQEYDVIASGRPAGPARATGPIRPGDRPRKTFVFNSDRPLRYLACVISRFNVVTTAELMLPSVDDPRAAAGPQNGPHGPLLSSDPPDTALSLVVQANPRQTSRGRATAERTAAVLQFYSSIIGDVPYPSFTLALSESELPGGHSPAYFAILNQPLPTSPFVWRNDPVSFSGYPTFFLAHELAHQWWGQAIGWKNYHEQWLSEGLSQYFAAMYAEKERGRDTFEDVLRQMRRWAIDVSPQGPIYLGYRLGHIKSDSRVFRAVIYNKAAMVLHMLRRMLGDQAFFRGLRTFYADWRFRKAGTDDVRQAMEKASGQDLTAFFEAWIYGTDIPRVEVKHTVQGSTAVVTIEQRGTVIPVPVTLTLDYGGGKTEELTIPVTERLVTRTLPLSGPLRDLVVNQEQTLAVFGR